MPYMYSEMQNKLSKTRESPLESMGQIISSRCPILLQNRKFYDLEIWHAASETQALQSLYKWLLWVDLDLFYGKVKLET